MSEKSTPLSGGVYLNEHEIAIALSLNLRYHDSNHDIATLAGNFRFNFDYLDEWPDEHGVFFRRSGEAYIWIPRSTPFFEFLTFCHEFHHARFAPDACLARDMDFTQISRYEGKASAFAAIAAMPQLQYLDEDDVYRAFGKPFRYCAHYRILHFKKHGW